MPRRLIVCGNAETICDMKTDHRTDAWKDEIAQVYINAAGRSIHQCGMEYDINSNFRDWHGGKCDISDTVWGYQVGCVCVLGHQPEELEKLAVVLAHEEGEREMLKYIQELESDYDVLSNTEPNEEDLEDDE